MKKILTVALSAAMILSMSAVSVSAQAPQSQPSNSITQYVGESTQLASQAKVNELNGKLQDSIVVVPNKFLEAQYNSVNRDFAAIINTNASVANTSYLVGLKGTGFKTSLTNFLNILAAETPTGYTIGTVTKSTPGGATALQMQDDFTAVMEDKLVEVTGSPWAPYIAKMKDLAKMGSIPAKIYFMENGVEVYVNYTVSFTGADLGA